MDIIFDTISDKGKHVPSQIQEEIKQAVKTDKIKKIAKDIVKKK